jgi:hypothetical protein
MFLCIDFTSKKAKIMGVETEKGKGFKVVVSLEFSLTDLSTIFGDYLRSASKELEGIRVSGSLDNTFHKIFVIPQLKKKMMAQALQAEVVKAFGGDFQFERENVGEVLGPGTKVNRKFMTVGIKRNALEDLSKMFSDSRIRPEIFTTYPLALQVLLDRLGLLTDDPLGFMELDYPTSRIVIFKGNEIRLTREVGVVEEDKDPDRSALAMDIYRTLLFYNENYPEERISKLVFTGSSATQQTMDTLTKKTGAEIIPFMPETIFQGMTEIPYIHPGCLGLALMDPFRFKMGFVPPTITEKKKLKRTLVMSASAFMVILAICILMVTRYSLDLKHINTLQGGVTGEIKMKEDRFKEMALQFVTHTIKTTEPSWSDFFMEQAAVIPAGVVLKELSLKKVKDKWQGVIEGATNGEDELVSLLLMEEVMKNFNQSPLFTGVKIQEKQLAGKQVNFKITYQLKRTNE